VNKINNQGHDSDMLKGKKNITLGSFPVKNRPKIFLKTSKFFGGTTTNQPLQKKVDSKKG